jgi:hypothetical protein
MSSFYVKNDVTNGYIPNTGKPNILFKAGDVVSGDVITRYIFNKNMQGINVKPTVAGAYVENTDGLSFIPLEYLDPVTNRGVVPPKYNKQQIDEELLLTKQQKTQQKISDAMQNQTTSIVSTDDTRFQTPTQGKPLPEKKPIGLVIGGVLVLAALYLIYDKKPA